ncbi:hypothetical protein GW17_00011281 [Ensete ventricosum]|nr:hypothetical protein GW17_00011281 [Ensete ventricosum]RZR75740.1 hypothetical protein BHM03_00000220 [Ensete ventricosum]
MLPRHRRSPLLLASDEKDSIFSSSEATRRRGGGVFSSFPTSDEGGQRRIKIVGGEWRRISRFSLTTAKRQLG